MKKVTLDEIMSWNPCEDYDRERIKKMMGRKKYISIKDVRNVKLDNKEDYLWFVLRPELIEDEKLHKIAVYAAKSVLPIWEKQYPDDKRPHEAIKAKEMWLRGKITNEELRAAESAAWIVAWSVASAESVRNAARSVAWSVARSAESARNAAWSAARSAESAESAESAAESARSAAYNKIISYVKRITKEK